MTTPTREQVIEWAEEAGAIQLHKEGWDTVIQGGIGDMQRFAVLAMEAGRDQGLREAKEVCEREAEGFGGIAAGPFATDFGKHTHNAMAAGAKNCAAAIEQLRGE